MANCHCSTCRRAHGTAFSTVLPVAKAGFRWTSGEELLRWYESSPGKKRWFCGTCGSHLISTRDANTESVLLRAGSIDGDPGLRPIAHAWVGSKADWWEIPDDLQQFEEGFPGAPPGNPDSS
jgi:hypothetical protein